MESRRAGARGGWGSLDFTTRFRFTTGGAVLVIWFAFYARAVLDKSFHAPPEISALMLAIVGWAFTSGSLREIGKKDDSDDGR